MDFFSAQDEARRKTRLLVGLFVLAIVSMVALTYLLLLFFVGFSAEPYYVNGVPQSPSIWSHFSWGQFLGVGALVTGVVLGGSAVRTMSLRGGGQKVAEMMGGRLVSGNPRGHLEKRLLNVVEEIAIASGTPVPQVYVMDNEPAINAFAAGYSTGDAVVAVTRGTLEKLNRSELQGVIAHEFSHIINGDMRLNIRLIGILFGILMVALVGRFIFRSALLSGASRNRDNNNVPFIALGIGLVILGYVGVFFGNLIKAAVSRQREYLADASAVQFTRDPSGIAGALMKIGGDSNHAIIQHPDAEELSHAYFEEGVPRLFSSLFATHPPLEDRIRKVYPQWDGQFLEPEPASAEEPSEPEAQLPRIKPEDMMLGGVILGSVLDNLQKMGQPAGQESLDQARQTLNQLPAELHQSAQEPYGARALIYALVLDSERDILEKQMFHLQDHADTGVAMLTEQHMAQVAALEPRLRLTLVDMALPALRQLTHEQYQRFKDNLHALIEMDDQITPFEWALEQIILHHLDISFEHKITPIGKYRHLHKLQYEIELMLSYLAHNTQDGKMEVLHAFEAAGRELDIDDLTLVDAGAIDLDELNQAMHKLAQLKPLLKPQLLKAAAAAVAADGKITALEMELLRAFSTLLDCPMPPLPGDAP